MAVFSAEQKPLRVKTKPPISDDKGDRYSNSFARSLDQGDSFRKEALSSLSKAESYTNLASSTSENARSINANYTQDFYNWMKTQPAVYGQGTMSRSMIDNMSVQELQSYADRYSSQKSHEILVGFNQTHHLEQGGQHIYHEHIQENRLAGSEGYVQMLDTGNKQDVLNKENKIDIGQQTQKNITKKMENDESNIHSEVNAESNIGDERESHIHDKVNGQVFGGFNPVMKAGNWVEEKFSAAERGQKIIPMEK